MKNKFLILNLIFSIVTIIFSVVAVCVCFIRTAPEKSDEDIFYENIHKAVEIRVSNDEETWGYGTGCFISSDGVILTNKHMVYSDKHMDYYDTIQVRLPSENDFMEATVMKVSETDDLATIKIDKKNQAYFSLANTLKDGEEIYTIGNPNGFGLSFLKGNVSSKLRNVIYEEKTINAIQTSFVVNEGNSGGPVFNKDGALVGIISFRLKDKSGNVIQGVSFAVPYTIIQNFLS